MHSSEPRVGYGGSWNEEPKKNVIGVNEDRKGRMNMKNQKMEVCAKIEALLLSEKKMHLVPYR